MADGIYINGRRPKSKKAIKEAIAANPSRVDLESTSMFGGYSGPFDGLPEGVKFYFVGPCPRTDRKFYGNVVRHGEKIKVE